jgi:hypothetical protein
VLGLGSGFLDADLTLRALGDASERLERIAAGLRADLSDALVQLVLADAAGTLA